MFQSCYSYGTFWTFKPVLFHFCPFFAYATLHFVQLDGWLPHWFQKVRYFNFMMHDAYIFLHSDILRLHVSVILNIYSCFTHFSVSRAVPIMLHFHISNDIIECVLLLSFWSPCETSFLSIRLARSSTEPTRDVLWQIFNQNQRQMIQVKSLSLCMLACTYKHHIITFPVAVQSTLYALHRYLHVWRLTIRQSFCSKLFEWLSDPHLYLNKFMWGQPQEAKLYKLPKGEGDVIC